MNISIDSSLRAWRLFASWAISAWEETRRNDLMGQASALAFWLLLSLVPSLAFMFAILKAFHLLEASKPYLLGVVTAGSAELVEAISRYVEAAQGAALGGVGVLTLLFAGFATLSRVKNALNRIWKVEFVPGYGSRVIEYLTVLAVTPFLLLIPVVVSALWDHPALQSLVTELPLLRPLRLLAAEYAGYPVYWLLLFYAYDYLPDTRVGWRAALLGAITAGTLLNAAQTFYLRIMLGLSGYNLVYGALALLPILMLWLFLGAVILLFGAQLGYVSRNYSYLLGRRLLARQPAAERAALALGLFVALLREFRERGEAVTVPPAARRVGLPEAVAAGLAGWLQQAGLIAPVANAPNRYVPAKPLEGLTVADALRSLGAIPLFSVAPAGVSGGGAADADALDVQALRLVLGEADRALEERLAQARIGELVERMGEAK